MDTADLSARGNGSKTPMNLASYLAESARRTPARVAVELGEQKCTYGELWSYAQQWAHQIRSSGIQPGETIVVCATEALEFLGAAFGAWHIGCTILPWSVQRPMAELVTALNQCEARGLIAAPSVLTALPLKVRESVLTLPDHRTTPEPLRVLETNHANSLALLLFTSGTSGPSKCVMFSHEAMIANVEALVALLGLTPEDRLLTPMAPELPAALATCILPSLAAGGTVVLARHALPARLIALLHKHAVTVLFAVPFVYELLCRTPVAASMGQLEHLRLYLTSSAPLQQDLFRRFHGIVGQPLRSIYCSSEAGTITYNESDDLICCAESVGRVIPGVTLKVCGDDGNPVHPGEEGEVAVNGPTVADGYLKQPELERKVFREGWVFTGDMGYLNEKGYLVLHGRRSDTINVAGHLVSPLDVEAILRQHPLISDVLVCGEPHPMRNEVVVAHVVARAPIDVDELLSYCRSLLPPYKVPSLIRFVPHLLKTDTGKVIRSKR